MKILLINHYAGSDEHGMEYRPFYIARELNKQGHQVDIVASSFSHLRRKNPEVKGFVQKEQIENVDFYWLRGVQYQGNGLARVLSMLVFVLKLFFFVTKLPTKYDAVVASSTYPLDIFPAWLIAKIHRAKLAFEIHDLWPLSPMELGGFSKWHPFIMLMQCGESFALRFSDKIISILPNTLEHCKAHGMREERFVHIPNGVLLSQIACEIPLPSIIQKTIIENKQKNIFLVGYVGSFGVANRVDFFLDVAKRTKDMAFFLVGDGTEKSKIQNRIMSEKLNNVYLFDSIPKLIVPRFLIEMDALVISWNKSPLYRFGISANKLFDYMSAEKPIVQSIDTPDDIITKAECGITVPADSIDHFVEALNLIKKMNEKDRKTIGRNGKKAILEKYNYNIISSNFLNSLS